MVKTRSKIGVIKEYFGFRKGDKASDFMTEIKALSSDERLDLAQGAARDLGLTQDQVDFELCVPLSKQ